MTKSELIGYCASETGVTVAKTKSVIDALFEKIKSEEKTVINGFGTFAFVTRLAHVGTDPRTGGKMDIAEKTTLKFKASPK